MWFFAQKKLLDAQKFKILWRDKLEITGLNKIYLERELLDAKNNKNIFDTKKRLICAKVTDKKSEKTIYTIKRGIKYEI